MKQKRRIKNQRKQEKKKKKTVVRMFDVSTKDLIESQAAAEQQEQKGGKKGGEGVAAAGGGEGGGEEGKKKRLPFRISKPTQQTQEKISFMLGVANIFITAMCLTTSAQLMIYWYTIKFAVMISTRAVMYKRKGHHYFLFDFCYFGNSLLLLYLWVLPDSPILFSVVFFFANGPLAWAVPLWKNSLVFHSLDKLTSCFIHISPAFVTWALLWNPNDRQWVQQRYRMCGLTDDSCSLASTTTFAWALGLYLLWQVLYVIRVEVFGRKKIQERGYLTSKIYMSKKGFLAKITAARPALKPYELPLFLGFQLIYTVASIAPTPLFALSEAAHTAFIAFVGLWSAWNGASFYFQLIEVARTQSRSSPSVATDKKSS